MPRYLGLQHTFEGITENGFEMLAALTVGVTTEPAVKQGEFQPELANHSGRDITEDEETSI
jgi:hypothetical protein